MIFTKLVRVFGTASLWGRSAGRRRRVTDPAAVEMRTFETTALTGPTNGVTVTASIGMAWANRISIQGAASPASATRMPARR